MMVAAIVFVLALLACFLVRGARAGRPPAVTRRRGGDELDEMFLVDLADGEPDGVIGGPRDW